MLARKLFACRCQKICNPFQDRYCLNLQDVDYHEPAPEAPASSRVPYKEHAHACLTGNFGKLKPLLRSGYVEVPPLYPSVTACSASTGTYFLQVLVLSGAKSLNGISQYSYPHVTISHSPRCLEDCHSWHVGILLWIS